MHPLMKKGVNTLGIWVQWFIGKFQCKIRYGMRKKVAWGLPLGPPLPPVLRPAEAQPGAMVRPAIPVLLLQLTNRSSATKGVPYRL